MAHVTRDAAYEEIWHLIHDYGIKPMLPEMIAEMRTANDEAAADYEVTGEADSTTVSDSQPDRDGADVLRGVESLQFSDGTVQVEG